MLCFALQLFLSFLARHTSENVVEATVINGSVTMLDTNETSFNNLSELINIFKKNWPVEDWVKTGFFEENYIFDINEYWLKFLPPSSGNFYALAIIYGFLWAIGIAGNFLVILLFLR